MIFWECKEGTFKLITGLGIPFRLLNFVFFAVYDYICARYINSGAFFDM